MLLSPLRVNMSGGEQGCDSKFSSAYYAQSFHSPLHTTVAWVGCMHSASSKSLYLLSLGLHMCVTADAYIIFLQHVDWQYTSLPAKEGPAGGVLVRCSGLLYFS